VGTNTWAAAIRHEGYFIVRLRVLAAEEGGQNRHLQSGLKATWTGPQPWPLPGLLELPTWSGRSIAPGSEAIVHVRPLEPSAWNDVRAGTRIGLCKNWPREIGEGVVIERVDVPERHVPPQFRLPADRTAAAATLRSRLTLVERARGILRRVRNRGSSRAC
jgi:hypothetical protein